MHAAVSQPWLASEVLEATIDRANIASLRCFTRCGFGADDDASSRTYAGLVHRPPSLELLGSTRE